jgi:hypothetical protein
MGAYVWQLERAELLYAAMVRFFASDCVRHAKILLETQKRVRDKLFAIQADSIPRVQAQETAQVANSEDKPFNLGEILKNYVEGGPQTMFWESEAASFAFLEQPTVSESSINSKKVSQVETKHEHLMSKEELMLAIDDMIVNEDHNKIKLVIPDNLLTAATADTPRANDFSKEFSQFKMELFNNLDKGHIHQGFNQEDYLEFAPPEKKPMPLYMLRPQQEPQNSQANINTSAIPSDRTNIDSSQSFNRADRSMTFTPSQGNIIGNSTSNGISPADQSTFSPEFNQSSRHPIQINTNEGTRHPPTISPFNEDTSGSRNSKEFGLDLTTPPPQDTPKFAQFQEGFFKPKDTTSTVIKGFLRNSSFKLWLIPNLILSFEKARGSQILSFSPSIFFQEMEFTCSLDGTEDACTFVYSIPLHPYFCKELPRSLELRFALGNSIKLEWHNSIDAFIGSSVNNEVIGYIKPIFFRIEEIRGLTNSPKIEGISSQHEVSELNLCSGFLELPFISQINQQKEVIQIEESLASNQERFIIPQFILKSEQINNAIIQCSNMDLTVFCQVILSKLGTSLSMTESLYQPKMNAQDMCMMLGYLATCMLPKSNKQELYHSQFVDSLQNSFPGTFEDEVSFQKFIETLDNRVIHNDLIDFYNEDQLNFVVSSWGKKLLPRRLETPEEVPLLINAQNLVIKVLSYHFNSVSYQVKRGRHHVYDLFLLERAKVMIEYGLLPIEAFKLLYWMDSSLFLEIEQDGSHFLTKTEYTLTFFKALLREVDKDTFNMITEHNISLDTLLSPFFLSNFAIISDSKLVSKFWDMQCLFSRFRLKASPSLGGDSAAYLGPMSAFHLLQVWLVIDSMDSDKFSPPSLTTVNLDQLQTSLTQAITFNLGLPWDQLLYSACNFMYGTLTRQPGAERLAADLETLERRAAGGMKRAADAVAVVNARLAVGYRDVRRLLVNWALVVGKERGNGGDGQEVNFGSHALKINGPDALPRAVRQKRLDREMKHWSCEDVLRFVVNKRSQNEEEAGLHDRDKLVEKIDMLNFLNLNGVFDPTIVSSSEIEFDKIATKWTIEDISTCLKSEMRDEDFFKQFIQELVPTQQQVDISKMIFSLFQSQKQSNGAFNSNNSASFSTFILSVITSLPESGIIKKRLLTMIAEIFQAIFNSSNEGQSQENHEGLSFSIVTGILKAITTFSSLEIPMSQLPSNPLASHKPKLLRATIGPSLLLSTPFTSEVSRQLAFRYCTSLQSVDAQLFHQPSSLRAMVTRASSRLLPGSELGSVARLSIIDDNDRLTGLRIEASQSIPTLERSSNPLQMLGDRIRKKITTKFMKKTSEKKFSEDEFLSMLDQTNKFYDYRLEYTALEQYDNYLIPWEHTIKLTIEMNIGNKRIGYLRIEFCKDMLAFKDPFVGIFDTSTVRKEENSSTYIVIQPTCLLLHSVFTISLLVRSFMTFILESDNSEVSKSLKAVLDQSLISLSMTPNGNNPSNSTLNTEHSLLSNLEIKESITSSVSASLIAFTIATTLTSN